jgi:hypothetical protein
VASNVIQSTASFSYQNTLGLGTDAIGNNFPFSIAGIITGGQLQLDIYSAIKGYGDFGGPATAIAAIGSVSINGTGLNYAAVPEPGTLLLLSAGLVGIAAIGRNRRAS